MGKLQPYHIDLLATKGDIVERSFVADDEFFQSLDGEVRSGMVNVSLRLVPVAEAYKVSIEFQGNIQIMCDRCLEPMTHPVQGEAMFQVRLSDKSEDDGELIQVAENDGLLDLAWQIYEQIALQIPLRHVHPEGQCPTAVSQLLDKLQADHANSDEASQTTDPRWEALRKLVQTNN